MDSKENLRILGSDETGTGDYFTPIVSACVYVPKENLSLFVEYQSFDSKKLSDNFIVKFFEENKHLFFYSWNSISQPKYNSLNKYYNSNQIKLFLHYSNLKNFLKNHTQLGINTIIIDQFSTLESIQKYESTLFKFDPSLEEIKQVDLQWQTHAEDNILEVGLASIVARYFLLRLMKKQRKQWDFDFPFGAAPKVDQAGREFIKIHGSKNLQKIAKMSFKNTSRILKS